MPSTGGVNPIAVESSTGGPQARMRFMKGYSLECILALYWITSTSIGYGREATLYYDCSLAIKHSQALVFFILAAVASIVWGSVLATSLFGSSFGQAKRRKRPLLIGFATAIMCTLETVSGLYPSEADILSFMEVLPSMPAVGKIVLLAITYINIVTTIPLEKRFRRFTIASLIVLVSETLAAGIWLLVHFRWMITRDRTFAPIISTFLATGAVFGTYLLHGKTALLSKSDANSRKGSLPSADKLRLWILLISLTIAFAGAPNSFLTPISHLQLLVETMQRGSAPLFQTVPFCIHLIRIAEFALIALLVGLGKIRCHPYILMAIGSLCCVAKHAFFIWLSESGATPCASLVLGGPFLASLVALRVKLSEFTIGKSCEPIWALVAGVEILFPNAFASAWPLLVCSFGSDAAWKAQDFTLLGSSAFITATFFCLYMLRDKERSPRPASVDETAMTNV